MGQEGGEVARSVAHAFINTLILPRHSHSHTLRHHLQHMHRYHSLYLGACHCPPLHPLTLPLPPPLRIASHTVGETTLEYGWSCPVPMSARARDVKADTVIEVSE